MSLITKLDPNVREARRRRAAVCAGLRKAPDKTGRAAMLALALNKFRRLSHLTGAQKDAMFKRVLQEAKDAAIV